MPDSHPIATPARSRASWLEVVPAGSPPPLAHVEAGQPCEIGGGGGQGHAVVDREGGQDQQPLQAGGSSHQRLRDRAGGEGIRITQEDRVQLQCQMFCKPVLPSTASFFDPKEIYLAMGKTGSHHFYLTSLTFFTYDCLEYHCTDATTFCKCNPTVALR
ncbi:hypothetical protein PVAP13_1KG212300 [Panicum virgatum]|uniref:Uncharacterized protein n=2 Tax=Panicum virgatum TaxID=38727 RepID=A0A8T0XNE0_PANVG|nr:hypothetical protein PVAP13_1KG212300 [Panicum virgatum]